jgi:hypothetical protein
MTVDESPDPGHASYGEVGRGAALKMSDRCFLVRFKPPELSTQPVIADTSEIQGDHLALINSQGKLAALFLLEVVESWSESDLWGPGKGKPTPSP